MHNKLIQETFQPIPQPDGKLLLREFYSLCPDGMCDITMLTENERKSMSRGSLFLVGPCQKAGIKNGNGRIYSKNILEREVQKYHEAVEQRRALGEADHPDSSVINLQTVSHICTKLWWDSDTLMGKFEILPTPTGNILKVLVEARINLGVSSRGLGSLRETYEGAIVEDDFELIAFDIVSDPSTPGAFLKPQTMATMLPRVQNEDQLNSILNNRSVNESREKRIMQALDSVLLKG